MLTEVCPNIFLNEISLPNTPLKYLNSYIIKDGGRPLIIDTGYNCPQCEESFFDGLRQLSVDPADADVIATHLHSDHSGLIGKLQERGANIMLGEIEGPRIMKLMTPQYWERMDELVILYDLKKYNVKSLTHPGHSYHPQSLSGYQDLTDGQVLTRGRYKFTVLNVPGHTIGHIALYEADRRFILSGDLVLGNITPTIGFISFEHDILKTYLDTLKKMRALPIDLMLTGHRAVIDDPVRRIDQMFLHHQTRLDTIKTILADGEKSVADTAALMNWNIKAKSWDDFPNAQKWFAAGEAMAHLEYLRHHQALNSHKRDDGVIVYSLL